MTKTIKCECGKEYSAEAKNCPNCGKVNPFGKKVALIATLIAIGIAVIVVIFGWGFFKKFLINNAQQNYEMLNE